MADTILTTRILLLNGSTQVWNESLSNYVLDKGEPAIEFNPDAPTKNDDGSLSHTLKGVIFKVGDGVTPYKDLPVLANSEVLANLGSVFTIDGESLATVEGNTEADKINNYIATNYSTKQLQSGNIAIVKTLIVDDKYSYTAYAYDGTTWAAMDGNYDAENVYFNDDMLFTYNFGKYKTSNGNVTIPSKGKSLKDILLSAHVDIIDPTMSGPSFSISASSDVTQEVGTTYELPSATATFTDGKYTYGYVTSDGTKVVGTNTSMGITASSIVITNDRTTDVTTITDKNSVTQTLDADKFLDTVPSDMRNRIVTDENQVYTFTADCSYPASTRTPTNNVGDVKNSETGIEYAPKSAGDIFGKTDTTTIKGYRKPFWGYKLTADAIDVSTDIDSTMIRDLQESGNSTAGLPTSYVVPANTKQVFFAAKKGTKSTLSIKNTTKEPATSVACTKITDVDVADARGLDSLNTTAYDVWYINLDASFSVETTLSLTWA